MEHSERIVATTAQQVLKQVRRAIQGKDHILVWALAAMLAKGHILIEDIPGVGKTTMALAFSKSLALRYGRVQFTPDVLPSDVTGYSVLDQKTGEMTYKPGAILCNLFLADELNRATSRTQSALLEAMEEGQVTVDGVSYPVPQPFIVIATQNPTGAAGTQLLPDSQMDRFMLRLSLGYPAAKAELAMLMGRQKGDPLKTMAPIIDGQTLCQLQQLVEDTYADQLVAGYAVALVAATRNTPLLYRGASPRATLALLSLSKALAQLQGRDYVLPEDVAECFPRCVAHRVLLSAQAQNQSLQAEDVLRAILSTVPQPKAQ